MSQSAEYHSATRTVPSMWEGHGAAAYPDAETVEACLAARAAVQAFDEAARRGESFGRLCELSIDEQRAVKAVSAVKSSTPTGIVEKALLLDYYFNKVGRRDLTGETFDVAASLAADAAALARSLIPPAAKRRGSAAD